MLVSPTSPTTAFRIGEKADDPLAMYLNDMFTIPANLAGVPAVSVPCGLDAAGLPVGLQFTAPVLGEPTLFRAAHALEPTSGSSSGPPLLAERLAPASTAPSASTSGARAAGARRSSRPHRG